VILPANEIAQRLKDGAEGNEDPLVITPSPDLNALAKSGSGSIDLRLGTWFASLRPSTTTVLDVFEDIGKNSRVRLTKESYIPFGKPFILHPRNFVLAVTLEWIRLPKDLAAYVVGKSSWGRRGLIIATATGIHPSFTGCLTLELANVGELPIAVYPGMQICQLFLHQMTSVNPETEASGFVAFGRPILGSLEPDTTAKRLRQG